MDGIPTRNIPKLESPLTAVRLKTEPVNRVEKLREDSSHPKEQDEHDSSNASHADGWLLREDPDAVTQVNRLLRQKGIRESSKTTDLNRYRFKRNRKTGTIDLFDESLQYAVLSLSMEEMATLARFLEQSSGVMSDWAG
jgi:hypothetical protein